MNRHFRKVTVLGSGVMGSSIAAHLANAGVPSLVLDIVPRDLTPKEQAAGLGLDDRRVRDRLARESVAALLKSRPPGLFSRARIELIETGNLEDDLPRVAESDWVIEVVKEDMAIKTRVLTDAARHLSGDAILSTNTSGLSLTEMAAALPEGLRARFLGTHFFNPPRYMRLLEMIPTRDTAPEVVAAISEFATTRLGKGVVAAKDTPNFIANRIGVHAMMSALKVMQEFDLTVEEVDALTGPPLGRPKSGTFRLADMVGLDTLLFVAENVRRTARDDESRGLFEAPDFLRKMVEKKLLGAKTGAGFYRKERGAARRILTLDLKGLEYREALKPDLPELAALRGIDDVGQRIRTLTGGDGRGSQAAWRMLAGTLSYAAMRLGEISDTADAVDQALKLGFNWALGPFETWDALGFRETVERLREDGFPLPSWVDGLYEAGATSLYRVQNDRLHSPTVDPGVLAPVRTDPRAVDFDGLRRRGAELRRNDSASLLDLGDDVLCVEFHSKMNTIDTGTIDMILAAADTAESGHAALVVANLGESFCAGANLMLVLQQIQDNNLGAVENIVSRFQEACNRLEYCEVPVVVAPHGRALGGGCEVVLAGNAVRAWAESYVGLVEIGAGLVPAGGGCMRLYRSNLGGDPGAAYDALKKTFETIGMAKVAGSAEEARDLGFLATRDSWSMHRDHLVRDAKEVALSMARSGYVPPRPRTLPVMGQSGVALLEMGLVNMLEGRFISKHDLKIGMELASILAGGRIAGPTTVSEQHMLDLERESFLRLCGEPKSVERMQALLKTGKPLRN